MCKPFDRRLPQIGVDQERAFAVFRVHHRQGERERGFSFAGQGAGKQHAPGWACLNREHQIAAQVAYALVEKAVLQTAPAIACKTHALRTKS